MKFKRWVRAAYTKYVSTRIPWKNSFAQLKWAIGIIPQCEKLNPILLKYEASIEMNKYKMQIISSCNNEENIYKRIVYTNDDINNPEEFIVCGAERPEVGCESVFKYKTVYIHYKFNLIFLLVIQILK